MYRKDQIKGIIALVLFGVIAGSYWLFGKGDLSLSISIVCLLLWLGSMFYLNKRFPNQ